MGGGLSRLRYKAAPLGGIIASGSGSDACTTRSPAFTAVVPKGRVIRAGCPHSPCGPGVSLSLLGLGVLPCLWPTAEPWTLWGR